MSSFKFVGSLRDSKLLEVRGVSNIPMFENDEKTVILNQFSCKIVYFLSTSLIFMSRRRKPCHAVRQRVSIKRVSFSFYPPTEATVKYIVEVQVIQMDPILRLWQLRQNKCSTSRIVCEGRRRLLLLP